ncbi:putative F-box protein At1g31000 [Papaver somniferum]|uniref:putative F-box protein At1g31000 n=1 Tax=Papaver somniferum TaxID=3469 RepID=UPI000E704443|nr:putative F-box protein At1g31000 [Papaver somniferum]
MEAAKPLLWTISPTLQTNLLPNYPGIRSHTPYLRGDGKIRVGGDGKKKEIWGTSIAELWNGKIKDDVDPRWRAWVESSHESWNQKNEEQQRRDLQVRWSILRNYLHESGFETHNHRLLLTMKSPEDDHQTIIFTSGSPDLGLQNMHRLVLDRGPFYSYDLPKQAVNGLLCLSISNMEEFLIYNPSTGEKLPWIQTTVKLNQGEENRRGVDCIELGFDPVSNQHKVICISSSKLKKYPTDKYGLPLSSDQQVGAEDQIVEVLTVGENTWRRIDAVPPYSVGIGREELAKPVYVNGNLYWRFRYTSKGEVIMGFDFGTESFRVIPIPEFYTGEDPEDDYKPFQPIELMEFHGRIAVLDRVWGYESALWEMHEDASGNIEWKHVYIYIPYDWNVRRDPSVVALTGTNQIFIQPECTDSVFYYNLNTEKYLRFPISPDRYLFSWEKTIQL